MNAPEAVPTGTPMPSHVMNTYGRLPFALAYGRGCRVWDTDGREYLDARSAASPSTRSATPTPSWWRRCRIRWAN